MPSCAKCSNDVSKVYDCDHTDFEEYCVECYTELHYYLIPSSITPNRFHISALCFHSFSTFNSQIWL